MPMKKAVLSIALVVAALPCAAQEWKSLRRDGHAMLSVDTQSIKRKGPEAMVQYLVDFRATQGTGTGETPYRSIVVSARVHCKNRTMAMQHTDAYAQYGARGVIVAKTSSSGVAGYQPLEPGSSDEDVWRYVCGESKTPLK